MTQHGPTETLQMVCLAFATLSEHNDTVNIPKREIHEENSRSNNPSRIQSRPSPNFLTLSYSATCRTGKGR